MPLIYCPECENQVSEYADKCIHCGYPIRKEQKPINMPPMTKHKSSSGCLTYILLIAATIIIAIIVLGTFGGNKSNSSSITNNNKNRGHENNGPEEFYSDEDYESLAYNYAQDAVKKNLKSPSTAEFPSRYQNGVSVTSLGNNEYKVVSWVDSENGFGAKIRSNFSVIIFYHEDKVSSKDLTIN